MLGVKDLIKEAESLPVEEPTHFRAVAWVWDESDAWLIGLMPKWDLREMVRRCWAKGVNPRAYNKQIPIGFEEVQGLDFEGRDLREKAVDE